MDIRHNRLHLAQITIANPNRFKNPAIEHSGWVFQRDRREHRVGDVQRALTKCSNFRQAPANSNHRTLNIPVRTSNPIAYFERAIQVDHQATKKVRKQIFCRKAHGNATDTTKG